MPDQNERLGGDHAPPSTSAVATCEKPCTYVYIRVSTVHLILSTLSYVWIALSDPRDPQLGVRAGTSRQCLGGLYNCRQKPRRLGIGSRFGWPQLEIPRHTGSV